MLNLHNNSSTSPKNGTTHCVYEPTTTVISLFGTINSSCPFTYFFFCLYFSNRMEKKSTSLLTRVLVAISLSINSPQKCNSGVKPYIITYATTCTPLEMYPHLMTGYGCAVNKEHEECMSVKCGLQTKVLSKTRKALHECQSSSYEGRQEVY